jgi:hypothetical protein
MYLLALFPNPKFVLEHVDGLHRATEAILEFRRIAALNHQFAPAPNGGEIFGIAKQDLQVDEQCIKRQIRISARR